MSRKKELDAFQAALPDVALDNLFPPAKPSQAMLHFMNLTDKQDLKHPDMANPQDLNAIIWFSVKGDAALPEISRLPAFDLMTAGIKPEDDDDDAREAKVDKDDKDNKGKRAKVADDDGD